MSYEIKATFKIKDEIKSENYLICCAESRSQAFAKAVEYATGLGHEEYKKWDDPEVLERELLALEFVD